ncbi:pre-B-cell leukemia transcription factor-interacting protein 1-like isoform X2 [Astyanax mexicanus]|uniref:Pre-B-cell leukemia transcription factor-interacting protein 1-like n=1 Tax=Astyanax mexicanus TaxID=7994 RepID=A0A8B9M463_ASTMX|nr:pre-B-cell leukemia transcription factor-interacting protein 1-like isoform X2 [Astyanax mexicanus]
MSDNSTGSSGSSNNSWTLLSPEEAAIDTAGSVDDGTESIGDAPSLSEEVAASSLEVKPSESETPLETVLSEEGHQVCQETSPDFFEECGASGLASVETDPDICAPVIHDTITSSPPDNDLLGAVPFSIATESSLFLPEEAVLEQETFPEVQPTFELPPKEIPASGPVAEVTPDPEPTEISFSPETPDSPFPDIPADVIPASVVIPTSAVPVVDIHAEVSPGSESPAPSQPSEAEFGSVAEGPLSEDPCPETVTSSVLEEEEEEPSIQEEETELGDNSTDVVREPETLGAEISLDYPEEGDGLRLRHVQQHTDIQRQSSDEEEEEEEEEEEFRLPERKEEKSGFSLNHLIIGALALLCLGSLFFSDFDGSELSDQELLEKLAQENKQISILEAQIQSQKEELDKALRIAAEKGATDKENAKMKEELSALPALKEELEALKSRITELTQLTAAEPSETSSSSLPSAPDVPGDSRGPTGPDGVWDKQKELKRQKSLLEESRKRLEGIKKHGWHKKGVRESLVELQQRLSEQVDHLGKRDEWKRKQKEHKDGKKVWTEKGNQWESGDVEKRKDWKLGKDKHDGGSKHKEHFKKYREEWDHKKSERKLERERRRQERPWQGKTDHHHHNHHKQQQQKQHDSVAFWRHQEEKLRRNQSPPEHCRGVADCAEAEGLVPVKLSEFQALLEVYVSKLDGESKENLEALRRLVAQFFRGSVFSHDHMLFSEFAEDVADILEDLADVLTDDDALEEEMEQFEKEALWKFAATSA